MAKRIFGIILNILIVIAILIILLVLYSVLQTKILKKDYTNFFGYTIFQVATGSMSPEMEEKDIIITNILSKEQINNLQIDDIIIFKQDNAIITHRIIEIKEDILITKGDANNALDNPIKRTDVIGKVTYIIPNIGIWEKVFTTPKVYISIIITVILLGITISLNKGNDKTKEENRDNNNNKFRKTHIEQETQEKTSVISGEEINEEK